MDLGELNVPSVLACLATNSSQTGSILPSLSCKPRQKVPLSLPKELQVADEFLVEIRLSDGHLCAPEDNDNVGPGISHTGWQSSSQAG